MVGPNAKNLLANFGWQMPVSQMPGKTCELAGILMHDIDNRLCCSLDLEQSSIFKLQGIAMGHGNRSREIEKHILALIRGQTNAATMTCIKIEGERARRPYPWANVRRVDESRRNASLASVHEIELRHGQNLWRLAGRKPAVGAHLAMPESANAFSLINRHCHWRPRLLR
jgi:hypothetical protein